MRNRRVALRLFEKLVRCSIVNQVSQNETAVNWNAYVKPLSDQKVRLRDIAGLDGIGTAKPTYMDFVRVRTILASLGMLLLCAIEPATAAVTVKTNHTDVNLWSAPGRTGHGTIGEIKRFEEIEVTRTRTLPSGERWLQVEVVRHLNGRRTVQTGWVDSKFFTRIETPVVDDQPEESSTEARANCPTCASNPRTIQPIPRSALPQTSTPARTSSGGFIWPVGGTVRSGFGYRRHPIKGVVKLHRGTDISGNNGAPVKAAKGGVVETSAGGCRPGRKSCNGGAGNMVVINHGDGTKTRYFHLNQTCSLPRQGSRISQGAVLGCVGATGSVTGPHLHFEVIKNGNFINPLTVLPSRRS